jgi:hypothetical protein
LSPDQVLAAAPNIALALLGIAALLMLVAFRLFRRSRTDSFWRRRRAAGQQGLRVFIVSAIMLVFSGTTCAIGTFGPRLLNRAATPTEASAVAIAPTDDLTLTAIFVPTQPETHTPSPSETPIIPTETATDQPSVQPSDTSAPPSVTIAPSATFTETSLPTDTLTPDVQLTANAEALVASTEAPPQPPIYRQR